MQNLGNCFAFDIGILILCQDDKNEDNLEFHIVT